MKLVLFVLVLALTVCAGLIYYAQARLNRAEDKIRELAAENARLERDAQHWKKAREATLSVNAALSQYAEACLKREADARADAEDWRQILADMESREMTAQEKEGVPDEKTRRALAADLDAPL